MNKEKKYIQLLKSIKSIIENEQNLIANMANITSLIKESMGYFWVGFYIVDGEELVLGPFQGTLACTRIKYGKGVCGKAWKESKTLIVPDVNNFDGHIACSALSKSEIVVPVFRNSNVVSILDIDSINLNEFDNTDKKYLEEICELLTP